MVLISSTNFLYSRGVAESASYSFSPRAMKVLNTGLLSTSLTPPGSELAAKAKSRDTRWGWDMAMLSPMMAPSLQPTTAACGTPR